MVLWTLLRLHASVADLAGPQPIGHPASHNGEEPLVYPPQGECGSHDDGQPVDCDTGRRTEERQGMETFLDLALTRFAKRAGRQSTKADEAWTFEHIQVSYVPGTPERSYDDSLGGFKGAENFSQKLRGKTRNSSANGWCYCAYTVTTTTFTSRDERSFLQSTK